MGRESLLSSSDSSFVFGVACLNNDEVGAHRARRINVIFIAFDTLKLTTKYIAKYLRTKKRENTIPAAFFEAFIASLSTPIFHGS